MKLLFALNKMLLFICASMYLGTGWSLILFSFPIASQLTPDNYYLQFVPQVKSATVFFTYMTMVMLASCIVFIISEWHSARKWYPIIVFVLVILATLLTGMYIFKYNDQMAEGIKDPVVLQEVLGKWIRLNFVRISIWTLEWLTLAVYYVNRDLKFKSVS